jgi:ABC-type phosphate transport system permease subunit
MNSVATERVSLQPSGLKARQQRIEVVIKFVLAVIAASGVLITTGVVLALVRPTIDFFQLVGFKDSFPRSGFPCTSHPIMEFGRWLLEHLRSC